MPFENVEELKGASPTVQWAILIVCILIAILAVVSIVVSIWLSIKYVVYNKRQNSANITGSEAARKILDDNGLQHIKVSVVGSLAFGNSYSHYFKKVRLRRRTNQKASITSLAMGAEKASLAIMDKENDKDMRTRVALTPIMYLGPVAFIPLIIIGVLLDLFIFNTQGVVTLIFAGIGLLFYVLAFVLSLMVLKTEVKAQKMACEILAKENLATSEEIDMMKDLFKLYNIEYINDMLIELLELILKILQIVAKAQSNSSSNNN